ncbi:hypothetical protein [Flammeovirga sp. SJP92]|uniref:hypothetical protein n=1 Tax=Flammeovirga sp. SJP92 TaxID=1775430 RepID=UPI000787FD61|nr:hypothetical protein [Flammeovirga sp. SJP92]KXX67939.1 hypothetical protein AVL50_24080 [Flammeovirga sp. SJP92]
MKKQIAYMIIMAVLLFSCEISTKTKKKNSTPKTFEQLQGNYILDSVRFIEILKTDVIPEHTSGKVRIEEDSIFLTFLYSNLTSEVNAKLVMDKDSVTVNEGGVTKAFLVHRKQRIYYVSLDRKAFIPFKKL